MIRTISLMSIFSITAFGFTAKADDKKPFDDSQFVAEAGSGGLHEVQLGKLATTRAKNAELKKFGQKIADDHTKANKALKEAAMSAGLTCPEKMNAKHQQEVDRFTSYKGDDFDKALVNHLVKDHEKDIAAFTRASKEAKSAQIKEFASTTLPTLQEHLKIAKHLQESLK